MSTKAYLCGASAAALIATLPAGVAFAQPATAGPTALDEVVVTARRKEENLQNVPVSVSVVTGDQIRQNHLVNVQDIQQVTPALTVTNTVRGGATPRYNIRGLQSFDVGSANDPSVTLYFDELGQTRPTGSNQLMFDLQSIQVLKGPQGTLFGRNTTGGAVLVTPNSPTYEFGGYIQGSAGNYDLRDIEGVINVPLGDTLAIRGGLKYTKRDGYLTNVISGQKLDDKDQFGARITLLWEPTDNLSSRTLALYFKNDSAGAGAKIDGTIPSGPPALPVAARAVAAPLIQRELALANGLGRYELRSNNIFSSKAEVTGIQNRTEWTLGETGLGELTLKNVIGFRRLVDDYVSDTDGSNLNLIDFPGRVRAHQWSEEFQVQGKAGKLNYVLGGFYFHEKARDETYLTQFGFLLPPGVPNLSGLTRFDVDNISYAAFGHVDFDLRDMLKGLSVSAGVRLTHDKRTVNPRSRNQARNATTGVITYTCALTAATTLDPSPLACGTPATINATEPTWDMSLNYQMNPDTLVYVAHRHGYKAGGINPRPSPTTGIKPYDAEKVNDIEVGLKTDFNIGGAPARLNIDAYHTWLSGAQRATNIALPNGTVSSQIANAAKAHIDGGEIELTVRPSKALTFNGGYSLVVAKYDRYFDNALVAGVVTPIDIRDTRFAYTPKHQVNARVRYVLPLAEETGEVALQASYYYQSSVYGSEQNTTNCGPGGAYIGCLNANAKSRAYGLVNLRAEWRHPFGTGVEVAAFANNVTNKYYNGYVNDLLAVIGTRSVTIGEPRTYGVELRVPFGAGTDD